MRDGLTPFRICSIKCEIQLISHTDPVGGRRYNQCLSKMRSAAVWELLVTKSIPRERISVNDWGLDNPAYSNDSYQRRILNRRVDVILLSRCILNFAAGFTNRVCPVLATFCDPARIHFLKP